MTSLEWILLVVAALLAVMLTLSECDRQHLERLLSEALSWREHRDES